MVRWCQSSRWSSGISSSRALLSSRSCSPSTASLAGAAVAALLAVSACKQDKEPQSGYQPAQTQYGQAGAGAYPPPGATTTATSPPGYAPLPGQVPAGTQPVGTAAPTATGVPGAAPTAATPPPAAPPTSAQPLDPAAAAAIQPVINEMAKAHTVAGAKPLGSALVGNFQTGQTLETLIQLQPQKCYTVVGTALPPVTELNVQLVAVTPIPNMAPVLAADSETGPTAVVGKKPNCYKWPFPLPASVKVVMQVNAGAGLAAAQVFEK